MADINRALKLAKEIESLTDELEYIKEKIREENQETCVLNCPAGKVLVTKQNPKWVLRKGVNLDRLARELGNRFSEVIKVTTNAVIRDSSTALDNLEEHQVPVLMESIERKEYKIRIGFRWNQGEEG
mgnify:CR=1 FL=1